MGICREQSHADTSRACSWGRLSWVCRSATSGEASHEPPRIITRVSMEFKNPPCILGFITRMSMGKMELADLATQPAPALLAPFSLWSRETSAQQLRKKPLKIAPPLVTLAPMGFKTFHDLGGFLSLFGIWREQSHGDVYRACSRGRLSWVYRSATSGEASHEPPRIITRVSMELKNPLGF